MASWTTLFVTGLCVLIAASATTHAAPHANDAYTNALPIAVVPSAIEGTLAGSTAEPGEPAGCLGADAPSDWYVITAARTGAYYLTALGPTTGPTSGLIAVTTYAGSSLWDLAPVADSCSEPFTHGCSLTYCYSDVHAPLDAGATYYVQVQSRVPVVYSLQTQAPGLDHVEACRAYDPAAHANACVGDSLPGATTPVGGYAEATALCGTMPAFCRVTLP